MNALHRNVASGSSRRELVKGLGLLTGMALAGGARGAPPNAVRATRQSFRPGEPWLDTAGKPIQAHGGSILHLDGAYYWYGENKERTTPGSGVWHWGMRCYRSTDLYNWTDLGLIIPPATDDPASPLHPASQADRPHMLHNPRTGKFVCWIKIMEKDGRQTRTVLSADRLTGPYSIVRSGMQPLGMNAGDFDLVVSPEDGKAYQYFERVHSELICADLSADYTDVSGYYSTHFPLIAPPRVREAPAYFTRRGRHYLITSGTTGYHPNPSEVATAATFHGPWTVLGDPHPSDRSRTSFNTQISSVFKHPGKKDLYIALGDRWIPDLAGIHGPTFASGDAYRSFERVFAKMFDHDGPGLTREEDSYLKAQMARISTSRATYAWLPIRFDGDRPVIEWRSEWRLEDFE